MHFFADFAIPSLSTETESDDRRLLENSLYVYANVANKADSDSEKKITMTFLL